MNSYYEKVGSEVRCIDDEIPFEIPESWAWCRLGVTITLLSGQDLIPSRYNSSGSGIPYITGASNFNEGELLINRWTNSPSSISKYGDLLITCKGTIGEMAINNVGNIHIARQVMSIRPILLNTNYVRAFLTFMIPYLQKNAHSLIPGISRDIVLSAMLPLPPYGEQGRIVNRLNELMPRLKEYGCKEDELSSLNNKLNETLSKSILQQAIQGKLVAQSPKDEPASELLKRIRNEKERLIKEKIIKREKNESIIFRGDDNKYYEQIGGQMTEIEEDCSFPDSWQAVRLGTICQLVDGDKRQGRDLCLDTKYLRRGEESYLEFGKYVEKDDAIILVDGENSGEVFITPSSGYMGSTFKQLWITSEMYRPYVLKYILFHKDNLRNSKKGAAIPHLNKEVFRNLIIGIPPFEEQKRISIQVDRILKKLK